MIRLIFVTAVLLLTPAAGICQAECERVVLACPAEQLEQGTPGTFRASVGNGDRNAQYTFNWTTEAGTVVSGQGTPVMTLDTAGLGGMRFNVTVEVAGFPQSCANSESCEVGMRSAPLVPHWFDHYANLSFEDEILRLDNFVIQLRQDPAMKGYIVVSAGEGATPVEVKKRARRALSYLVNRRGADPARVVLVYGGVSYDTTELWFFPNDVKFPFPGEIIKPGQGKVRGGHRRNW